MGQSIKDVIMCKETEKLVKILQGSQNPTDMGMIILANKMDEINTKLDKNIQELDRKFELRFNELSQKTDKQIEELRKSTHFARWVDSHKKPLTTIFTFLTVLAFCGVSGIVTWLKNKLGL